MNVTPAKIGLLVVLVCGLVHGLWTRRWERSSDLDRAVPRLGEVPLTVGPWQGKPEPLDERMAAFAGVAGSWMRRYTHAGTGQTVTVLLMCGRPGPVAVHTPEWCYRGVGFVPEPAESWTVTPEEGGPAEFWVGKFRQEDAATPRVLRILWSWNATGRWQAPNQPRLAFARHPVLYKLYVIRELSSPTEGLEEDAGAALLRELLPVLDRTLFPAPEPER
jgi:hypothetical protein